MGVCERCGKKQTYLKKRCCDKCYTKYYKPKKECYVCKKISIVIKNTDDGPICRRCYNVIERPKKECCICKQQQVIEKRTKDGFVCKVCYYKYEQVKKECSICKKNKITNKNTESGPICKSCYNKFERQKKECYICKKTKIVSKNTSNGPICKICYDKFERPKKKCQICKKTKIINHNSELGPICKGCYKKNKLQTDFKFYIITKIRDRLGDFLKCKNIKTSDEYGINYKAIAEHLGPCPGDRGHYHIDHILPLSAFDFDDPMHIRAAFAPENHQWLTAKENLKKGVQYNKEDFDKYIKNFQKKHR